MRRPSLLVLSVLLAVQTTSIARAQLSHDLLGEPNRHVVSADDTLLDVARWYDLGFVEIVAANPAIDPWLPRAGTVVLLPTAHVLPSAPRRGIVINLADQRLYYFPPRGPVQSYPIGIASDGMEIVLGVTRVVGKRVNPTWVPPPSVRADAPDLPPAVPPGPDNPLGAFALDLGWTSTAIHGTNNPDGVGRRVSHGCFRLYPEDIAKLFPQVAVGTEVHVVNQPVKVGWSDETLLLEVHPTLEQADELESRGAATPTVHPDLAMTVMELAGAAFDEIDWPRVEQIAREHRGIPYPILVPNSGRR